ncbi:MAG TPA: hypothetical protein VK525_09120 [Candidatus Saccharimonadales bacterium]|nr:hypothetical protein [Candidatus Saccharimonadales bacterium]
MTQTTTFNAFAGYGTRRPNCVDRTSLSNEERSTAEYFNVAAFQIAPQFTLGSWER